jgi:hypothetical protein
VAGSEETRTAAGDAGKQLYRAEALEAWLRPQREEPPPLPKAPRNARVMASVLLAFAAACWLVFGLPLPRSSRWDATLDRSGDGCVVRLALPPAQVRALERGSSPRYVGPGGVVLTGLEPHRIGDTGAPNGPLERTRLEAAATCPAGRVLPLAGRIEVSHPSRPLLASRAPDERP